MADEVADWLVLVHDAYPPAHAAEWDRVGLQVGDPEWPVERVVLTLDVTSAVIAEAAQVAGTLVLAHYPLFLRPLERLTSATAPGRVALAAARAGVAVVATHTNLDVATDGSGTSDPVMDVLEVEDAVPLTSQTREAEQVKLVTFVPAEQVDAVLDALAAAGAGTIGDYDRCSFRAPGTGTFRPRPGSRPFSGSVGRDNAEPEDRLEVVVPRSRLGEVVRALRRAHPYEEVAYDLYPLLTGSDHGFGRVGTLPQPVPLRALAARLREGLPAPHLRYAGLPDRTVRRVAAVGGAGDSLIGAALAARADVYVTGDLRHHVVLDALEMGLAVVDAGHHATEWPALGPWLERLTDLARARGLTAQLLRSPVSTVPWTG